jgi:HK97 gp10 family phage protein
MARVSFKIEGLSDLDDALTELPKATARNVLVRVLKKEAEPIRAAGERYAPRLTGKLAVSYTVSTVLSSRQRSMNRKESDVEVYVGPAPLAQATQTEFGNAHQAPHPHLRPAWDQNVNKILDNITKDLSDEIDKAVARLARKAQRLAAQMKA